MPTPNAKLHDLLLEAYRPCPEFSNVCHDMRWDPKGGHVPRGFCGATAALEYVQLVLVASEPGDPHPREQHPCGATDAFQSAYDYAYECFRSGRDLFHRNIRLILDLCWPGEDFDTQMRRAWITDSVLCSAKVEGGRVRAVVGKTCRGLYLERQLAAFPQAVVVALGTKAAKRLAGLEFIRAFAAAPPGCNFQGARKSWEFVASEVHRRAV